MCSSSSNGRCVGDMVLELCTKIATQSVAISCQHYSDLANIDRKHTWIHSCCGILLALAVRRAATPKSGVGNIRRSCIGKLSKNTTACMAERFTVSSFQSWQRVGRIKIESLAHKCTSIGTSMYTLQNATSSYVYMKLSRLILIQHLDSILVSFPLIRPAGSVS